MKENDIRKREVMDKYCALVEKDIGIFFKASELISVQCPACGSKDHSLEFKKSNFSYVSCMRCATLFTNPRPKYETLREFYSDSESTSFWISDFFKPVANARREKIFRPRAEYASRILDGDERRIIGDIGAGFGLFLDELRRIMPNNRYIAIEPSVEMSGICHEQGLEVIGASLEDTDEDVASFDLLTAFELMEHLFDPVSFLKKVYSLLRPKGHFFLTTLNGKGFDILLLWERSKIVMPPHHLNFFNTKSIRILLEEAGFEIVEISTPGKLDWDIVEGGIRDEGLELDRFWKILAYEGSDSCKKDLQDWISKSNLSSHMSVLARKTS